MGRESEVALLLERWQQSQAGLGQVVLLSGEAGIGKSRLVEVLRQRVVSTGSPRIVLRCSPYHTHSALYPVIQHLQRVLEWRRDETPAATLDTLERTLQVYDLAADEAVPLVAALLSVPIPEGRYPICAYLQDILPCPQALLHATCRPAFGVWGCWTSHARTADSGWTRGRGRLPRKRRKRGQHTCT